MRLSDRRERILAFLRSFATEGSEGSRLSARRERILAFLRSVATEGSEAR